MSDPVKQNNDEIATNTAAAVVAVAGERNDSDLVAGLKGSGEATPAGETNADPASRK